MASTEHGEGRSPHHDAAPGLGGGRRFDTGLDRMTDDGATAEAAARRAVERELRRQAGEEATLGGVLVDLGEADTRVTVGLRSGRRHAGVVRSVSADACILATDGGQVAVRLAAIDTLRLLPGHVAVEGDRSPTRGRTLHTHLSDLAADRAEATVATSSGALLRGRVRSVGRDVLVLVVDGSPPAVAYVPLAVVDEVAADTGT